MIYVVTMYRWGDRECHSYVTWAGRSKSAALKAADAEEEYRGGKYNAEVLEFGEDGKERRVIVPLVPHPRFGPPAVPKRLGREEVIEKIVWHK